MPENISFNSIKNWDKKTWLSSPNYVRTFNKFLIKHTKITKTSKILDIGCGRGKILGNLSSKLKLRNKPLGIDIENHKDKDKRINFKRIDAISFFKKTKKTFDLILIKQTIHLLKVNEIEKLLALCMKKLDCNGKLVILTLDPSQNQIPTFPLMSKRLKASLKRDKIIVRMIFKLYPQRKLKKFIFNVKIYKRKYIEMIKNKYISILLNFSSQDISDGVNEINLKFKKILSFKDKLQCVIIESNYKVK